MIRIEEDELKSILDKYNNVITKISLKGVLSGEFIIEKGIYKCDVRSGNITIIDKNSRNSFVINIFPVYKILRDKDYSVLELYLDYDLEIKLEKYKFT